MRVATRLRPSVAFSACCFVLGLAILAPAQTQQPVFRSAVDLVAVEVQVLDRNGQPLSLLGPDKFDVTIGGKRRRVVSADFIRYTPAYTSAVDQLLRRPGDPATPNAPGRVFILAIDMASFTVGQSRGVVTAARGFLARLEPSDEVGLVAYPIGPTIHPTTDHAAVARQLDTIVGTQQFYDSQYHLTPAEIIDINADMASARSTGVSPARGAPAAIAPPGNEGETLREVQLRECGGSANAPACVEAIQLEASTLGFLLEGQVTESLSALASVLRGLYGYDGRKTVVVLSAGMPASDRPGGRPDVQDMGRAIGEAAARANATIYALHIQSGSIEAYSADKRRAGRQPADMERESAIMGKWLDRMASASGGAMLRVLVGSGEGALDRVLRETSAHYLLGVEPGTADRDGKVREMRVKVNEPNVTVRSRLWVVIPKK